jgi:hypothetical protein
MLATLRRHSTLVELTGIWLAVLVRALKGPAAVERAWDQSLGLILGVLSSMLADMLMAGSLRQHIPAGALAK